MEVLQVSLGLVAGLGIGWGLAVVRQRWLNRDRIRKHPWGMGEDDPYRLHESVLTRSEDTWYRALTAAMPEGYVIFNKVRLADLFQVTYAAKDRGEARSRLTGKMLHFVICDAALQPKMGILLLPETPDRAEAQGQQWITRICDKAGLSLLTVSAVANCEEIAARARAELSSIEQGAAASAGALKTV